MGLGSTTRTPTYLYYWCRGGGIDLKRILPHKGWLLVGCVDYQSMKKEKKLLFVGIRLRSSSSSYSHCFYYFGLVHKKWSKVETKLRTHIIRTRNTNHRPNILEMMDSYRWLNILPKCRRKDWMLNLRSNILSFISRLRYRTFLFYFSSSLFGLIIKKVRTLFMTTILRQIVVDSLSFIWFVSFI